MLEFVKKMFFGGIVENRKIIPEGIFRRISGGFSDVIYVKIIDAIPTETEKSMKGSLEIIWRKSWERS